MHGLIFETSIRTEYELHCLTLPDCCGTSLHCMLLSMLEGGASLLVYYNMGDSQRRSKSLKSCERNCSETGNFHVFSTFQTISKLLAPTLFFRFFFEVFG